GKSLKVNRTEPVFDGYFSNECYRSRLEEAIAHYAEQVSGWQVSDWETWIFHQPYAFQGRRMSVRFWMQSVLKPLILQGDAVNWNEMGLAVLADKSWDAVEGDADLEKVIAKSASYKAFVAQTIAPGERASAQLGNLYTGAVLMSLCSVLADAHERGLNLANRRAGFFAYGPIAERDFLLMDRAVRGKWLRDGLWRVASRVSRPRRCLAIYHRARKSILTPTCAGTLDVLGC
ncbi:MAG: hypothetical protein RIR98_1805, partial [Bacteroidota bacterium]